MADLLASPSDMDSTLDSLHPTKLQGSALPSSEAIRFSTGTLLADRYRIVDLLGRGGMGEVYRADDLKLGQQVALKLLPEAMEEDPRAVELILNEVRIARKISHPNVCRVHDVVEIQGRHLITMEYIDGENLARSLRRLGRPPEAKARDLALQICLGLAAAHEQGVLHRDLKPANLMVDSHGRAKITDFGIAVLAEHLPKTGKRAGTPAYMAPEQLTGEGVSVRSDLYSLGLVLYELFTGERALGLGASGPPDAPSKWVEGLSRSVDRVIFQCLEDDPVKRPASALKIAMTLRDSDAQPEGAVLKAIVDCRLASTSPPEDDTAEPWMTRFQGIARELLQEHEGYEVEPREGVAGLLLVMDRPVSAVRYALALHKALGESDTPESPALAAQVGIHLGEVMEWEGSELDGRNPLRRSVTGPSLDVVSGLAKLATEGQSLLSRAIFDLARQTPATGFEDARWMAHGSYEIDGLEEPLEIFEVGREGFAPLALPEETPIARRRLVQETIVGWRPAPGLAVPFRPNWRLERKLEEGGFGEVWLAAHEKTRQRRVLKFCYEPSSLRSLKREITLFRLLKEELGERADITRIVDWNFDDAPYFIEAEYTEGGNLQDWSERKGGLQKIPLETRVEIVAQVATALAAAHSVGILHKDVKPANVLVANELEDEIRVQLSDFGIGQITQKDRLELAGITVLGMTEDLLEEGSSGRSGTRLYMAPELLVGQAATMQADIYALGVMLYQLVVGDFSSALAPGWERYVDDELLREDIARAVDGSLEDRLSSATLLAERLRSLETRRQALEEERRRQEQMEQAIAALALGRQRRKLALAVIAVLLVFAGSMAFMWRKVAQESEKVTHEAEVARQVSEFLVDLFKMPAPEESLGKQVTAVEILDKGAERIEAELADQPEIQARLMYTMGKAYQSLGQYQAAGPLFETSLEINRSLYGQKHLETAKTLHALADIERVRGSYTNAEALVQSALEIFQEFPEERLAYSQSLGLHGRILQHRGELDLAETIFNELLASYEATESPLLVSESLDYLGLLMAEKGNFQASEDYLQRSLQIKVERLGHEHPDSVIALGNLGCALFMNRKLAESKDALRRSLEFKQRVFGAEHPELTQDYRFLFQIALHEKHFDTATSHINKVIKITKSARGLSHPHYAGSLTHLAELSVHLENYKEAIRLYEEATSIFSENVEQGDGSHLALGVNLTRLAEIYFLDKAYAQAELAANEALHSLNYTTERIRLVDAHKILAQSLIAQNRHQQSMSHLNRAIELAEEEKEVVLSTQLKQLRSELSMKSKS